MGEDQGAGKHAVIERAHFQQLLDALQTRGYQTIGPVARNGAIQYETVDSVDDLPAGWSDVQEPGHYRLERRDDPRLFGCAVGPHSWKQYLHPPAVRMWQAKRDADGFHLVPDADPAPRFAFLGVRACDLHAIAIQDQIFLQGKFKEPHYADRRANSFIIAVNCSQASGTCFCASLNAGPKAARGYDLALTEVLDQGRHYFLTEVGSARGAEVLAEIDHSEATPDEREAAEHESAKALAQMGRSLDCDGLKELLYQNYEHPHWDRIAQRCLNCANCTLVCPTCFCTTVEDVTDLSGENAERWRKWDSCFTMSFSHIHGGSVRYSASARYRQWMTHQFATWSDQFGAPGCSGCGRCITWCPVGIDITAEVSALRGSVPAQAVTAQTSEDNNGDA